MKNLTKKEAEFSRLVAVLGNEEEAAYKAGFTVFPGKKAEKLMKKKVILEEIERVKKANARVNEVLVGLRRIAFGPISDAVALATNFGEYTDTNSLDLFSISEIKYQIGKGVEIKFYDRLKALEKLYELENARESSSASSIYEAIMKSARKENDNDE